MVLSRISSLSANPWLTSGAPVATVQLGRRPVLSVYLPFTCSPIRDAEKYRSLGTETMYAFYSRNTAVLTTPSLEQGKLLRCGHYEGLGAESQAHRLGLQRF